MLKTKVLLFISVLSLSIFVYAHSVSAASFVTFHQKIGLLPCTLTTVFDTDGNRTYTISSGCGKLVPALQTKSTTPTTSQLTTNFSGNASNTIFSGGNTRPYLDSSPQKQPRDGYMLLAEVGSVYEFYLNGDSKQGQPRLFKIIAIREDTVVMQLLPSERMFSLRFDERTEINIAYDERADVVFRLVQIRDDGSVLLHLSFPPQPGSENWIQDHWFAFTASTLLVGASMILLHGYIYSQYLLLHHLPAKEWWINHVHEPLEK